MSSSTPRIFVAGHAGLVGSALVRRWTAAGIGSLLLRRRSELDLTDKGAVDAFSRRFRVSVLDEVGVQRVERAAVGDEGDVFFRRGEHFVEHGAGALHEGATGLATGRGEVEFAGAPACDDLGVFLFAIRDAASFENTEGQFAQPRVGFDGESERFGQRGGGVTGAREVATEDAGDGVAAQPGR